MKKVKIAGVSINLSHESLKFKNFDDLKKNEQVFSHLKGQEKEDAQKELAESLGLAVKAAEPAAGK